jgi:hypothetical protein
MQNIKKFTIIHLSLLALSLLYSFIFYNSISIELAVMAIIFDLVKPNIFITALESKQGKRMFFGGIVAILVLFNLLAISSNFINNYTKQSTSRIINSEFTIHNKQLKQSQSNVENIKNELNSYPILEIFLSKSPTWEDKTELANNWQQGKQDISKRLDTAQTAYNTELSKNIEKYKISKKQMGYSAIFASVSSRLNVDVKNLILGLYILFAMILEVLIFYTKTLSVKEFKNYVKTPEEMTSDLIKQSNLEMHKRQLEAIQNVFSNNVIGNIQKVAELPKQIDFETYVIPESKEKIRQIEEPTEKKENPLHEESKNVDEEIKNKYQYIRKTLDIDNIRKYHQYILDNLKDENIVVGIKKVALTLGLTQGEAMRIYNKLRDKDYLKTLEDKKTRLQKKKFNANDFLEV